MQLQSILLVAVVLLSSICLALACRKEAHEDRYDSDVITRPDRTPCRVVIMPGANEFIIHFTRNKLLYGGITSCLVYRRRYRRVLRDGNLLFITSPGFHFIDKYPNNRLVFYNLSCGEGHQMTLQFTKFDLQEKVQPMSGPKVCVDYVNISSPSLGADMIFCGRHNNLSFIHIPESSVFITFRSSGKTRNRGFSMTATCLPIEESSATAEDCEDEMEPEKVKHLSFITERLLYLHRKFTQAAHLLSGAEYEEMLKLGIESEEVCNPIVKAVGAEVLKSFPEELVKQYKTTSTIQDWDYNYYG